jgi:hypothetical protein
MSLVPSVAAGRTDVPLIEETIGAFFDAMAAASRSARRW